MKVLATVVCPICGQAVMAPQYGVCWSHCDGVGKCCPFSGQPFGSLVQGLAPKHLRRHGHDNTQM